MLFILFFVGDIHIQGHMPGTNLGRRNSRAGSIKFGPKGVLHFPVNNILSLLYCLVYYCRSRGPAGWQGWRLESPSSSNSPLPRIAFMSFSAFMKKCLRYQLSDTSLCHLPLIHFYCPLQFDSLSMHTKHSPACVYRPLQQVPQLPSLNICIILYACPRLDCGTQGAMPRNSGRGLPRHPRGSGLWSTCCTWWSSSGCLFSGPL